MLFSYTAKSSEGKIFEGVMEAPDRFVLSHELKTRGNIPLSISEKKEGIFNPMAMFQRFFGKVSVTEQIIFTKNLGGMLRAGLSLNRALSVLKKQTKNPAFLKILISLEDEINAGGMLSSGLEKFPKVFSKLFVSMMRAGEESGNLAGALVEVGTSLEKSHALTKKVRGALIYPGVILSVMVVVGILMFAFVVPGLAKTFKELNVQLPASTKFIIFLGDFLSNHLILSFAIIIGFVLGVSFLFRASFAAKYIDFIVLKLPIIGSLVKELNTARTTRTLSSLILSGVSITRAIEITEDVVQNVYYKKVLREARGSIEKGSPFSEAFSAYPNLYPIMMSEMVQVGEETGKLADMLLDVSVFYEEEIEGKTKNFSTIIEPVLMVFIGGGVGFFAISMISPMYSIMDNIK
ncbi:MAG: type II secretion system F family protein [Minisyncoccia bacterium]